MKPTVLYKNKNKKLDLKLLLMIIYFMKDESSGGCHGRLEDVEAVPRLTSPRLHLSQIQFTKETATSQHFEFGQIITYIKCSQGY